MRKSTRLLSVITLLALVLTSQANAQYASDNISRYGKQKMQELKVRQPNVQHNTLTASNARLLPSNVASWTYFQQRIPENMRSHARAYPPKFPRNNPRVLASNSPKLREKKQPKRPPALPVVF